MTVMVYPMCLRSFQLGNTLGYYFNDIACSDAVGSHFISTSKHFDINESAQSHKNTSQLSANPYAFFQYLPDIIVHDNPNSPSTAKPLMKSKCDCLQYCWENAKAPWIERTSLISAYLRHAINGYVKDMIIATSPHLTFHEMSLLSSIKTRLTKIEIDKIDVSKQQQPEQLQFYSSGNDKATGRGTAENSLSYLVNKYLFTQLNNETDMIVLPVKSAVSFDRDRDRHRSTLNLTHVDYLLHQPAHNDESQNYVNHAPQLHLPLVPNVTIQYRCGDNIGFGKTRYGLLPYRVYKQIIHTVQAFDLIYIIADSPTRNAQHVYSNRCTAILEHLVSYLHKSFPSSVIVMKRGGDMFLDYARLAYSDITICSASTFCIWPALANSHGQVHYPLTPLIAKADNNQLAPNFSSRFHWIDQVDMIKEFRQFQPWYKMFDVLEAEQ